MDVLAFVDRAGVAGTTQDLFEMLLTTVKPLGMDYLAYAAITYDAPRRDSNVPPPGIMVNYPETWVKHYFAKAYDKCDPVVLYSPSIAGTYEWSSLPSLFDLDPMQVRVLQEAGETGLCYGLTVPIHGPHGQVAVLSFASSSRKTALWQEELREITIFAAQFHLGYSRLANCEPHELVRLSAREKECLRWTAAGKSSWDIGVILAISENTVNFHLKNVMRKLGTSSRMVAVLKAIELGLINVSSL